MKIIFYKRLTKINIAAIMLLFTNIFILNSSACAQALSITNRYVNIPLLPAPYNALTQTAINDSFDLLEARVNTTFSDVNQTLFLESMANAGALANKGLGVDYASHIDYFIIGAEGGIAATEGDASSFKSETTLPPVGLAFQAGINIGFRPSLFIGKQGNILDNSLFYLRGLTINVSDIKELDLTFSNFGAYWQYDFDYEKSILAAWLLKWGGIRLTSGLEYSRLNLLYSTTMNLSEDDISTVDAGGTPVSLQANFDAVGNIGARITNFSIPFEASTSIRILYFLSFFIGGGLDFNFGSANTIANLQGDIIFIGNSPAAANQTVASATGNLNLSETGKRPTFITSKYFLGWQINIWFIKLYFKQYYASNNTEGMSLGIKLVY